MNVFTNQRPPTILVVDDEEPIRDFMRALFRQTMPTAEVVTASEGASGLRILGERTVDLIISDYRMPGMDGVSFLAEAEKVQRGVPKILLTGYADMEVAIHAINSGKVTAFYTKPATAAVIAKAAKDILTARLDQIQREQAFARAFRALDETAPEAPRIDLGGRA